MFYILIIILLKKGVPFLLNPIKEDQGMKIDRERER